MTAQLAMPLRAPARDRQESITAEVLRVLEERGGEWISQAALGDRVFYRLAIDGCSGSTRGRRVKDSIRALRLSRVLIASGPLGYRLDSDKRGLHRVLAQLRSEAELLRAYDAGLADRLTGWLDEAVPPLPPEAE